MKSVARTLCASLLGTVALVGCETTERITTVREVGAETGIRLGTTDPAIIGNWMLEEGVMFPDLDTWLRVTAIEFPEDGRGWINFRDTLTGAVSRVRMFCVYDGEKMVIDMSREEFAPIYFPDVTMSFPLVVLNDDALSVADENEEIAIFSKQTTLPPAATPSELSFGEVHGGLPAPQWFSDLVPYEDDVIYTGSSGVVHRVDLETFAMEASPAITPNRILQTKRQVGGLDRYFTHCGCGGSREAFEQSFTATYDIIDTDLELDHEMSIRAAAWVPETNLLWLHGRDASSSWGSFVLVNVAAEPDVLVETKSFNRDLRGLTWDGSSFWAIVEQVAPTLCRIDPHTAAVVESFRFPDPSVRWTGITIADDGNLYVMGTTSAGDAVIAGTATTVAVPEMRELASAR